MRKLNKKEDCLTLAVKKIDSYVIILNFSFKERKKFNIIQVYLFSNKPDRAGTMGRISLICAMHRGLCR